MGGIIYLKRQVNVINKLGEGRNLSFHNKRVFYGLTAKGEIQIAKKVKQTNRKGTNGVESEMENT